MSDISAWNTGNPTGDSRGARVVGDADWPDDNFISMSAMAQASLTEVRQQNVFITQCDRLECGQTPSSKIRA